MKSKPILFTTIALFVFLLVIGTSVVVSASFKNKAILTPTQDVQVFLQREQQYQQLINEANQKIDQANQQITILANAPTEVPQPYLFSSEQASQIAANLAKTQPANLPELVSFDSQPAYEVVFDQKGISGKVYIDANTGAVLYNGLSQSSSTAYISTDQAVQIATNYLGGGTVTQANFANYNGATVYVVSFTNGQSVYVALNGQVVAVQLPPSSSSKPKHESDDDDD